MDIVPSLVNGLIATVAVAFVTYITHHQHKALKDSQSELKQDLRDGFARVDRELAGIRVELRSEIASVRSDLTQIALVVGAQPRPQTG